MLSVREANDLINSYARDFGVETIELAKADGRILAENIESDRNYPPFNRSAMDGYAIRQQDFGVYKTFKITGELHAGDSPDMRVAKGNCVKIMTGTAVPEDCDAVIRIEDCKITGDEVEFSVNAVKPWQNISRQGEDCGLGEILVKKGEVITPAILGVLAVIGKSKVTVYQLPKLAIISTGNEVIPIDHPVKPYQIRDSNSYALAGFFEYYKISPTYKSLVKDDKQEIISAVKTALNCEIIIISGGVSMGDADFVPDVLSDLGVKKVFHKVKIKPGKPIWFGIGPGGQFVFALPGNPMSCQVAFKVFIEPFILKCFSSSPQRQFLLPIDNGRKKKTKFEEYFPCKIVNDGTSVLREVSINGSGDISSTIHSDGLAIHEEVKGDLQKGELLRFLPWRLGR
ncbi:MAG: molybdopterin molybdotransferase MoeA [Cytophagaceae bacterium]